MPDRTKPGRVEFHFNEEPNYLDRLRGKKVDRFAIGQMSRNCRGGGTQMTTGFGYQPLSAQILDPRFVQGF